MVVAALLQYLLYRCIHIHGVVSYSQVLCTVVAALLQYLFLCVFCWMLSEGIMLYLLVVKVFGNLAKRWYLLLLLGWGKATETYNLVTFTAGIFPFSNT